MNFPSSLVRSSVAVRRLAVASVVASCALAGSASAQAPKIAVIEVERILRESDAGKEALATLEAASKVKGEELESRAQALQDLQKRYQETRLTLADDRLAEMQKELEDKTIEMRRLQDDANRELQKQQQEAFQRIEEEVLPIINQIGREGGYTLMFNKFQSGLVFADEGVDITQSVIERYNASRSGN